MNKTHLHPSSPGACGEKDSEKGLKTDSGKLDWSLLPLSFVKPLVPVFTIGEQRYGYENWKKPFDDPERRFNAAMKRHLDAYEEAGPLAINEADGGVYHLAQIAWNCLMLLHHFEQAKKSE
jgi:hypothetical protein